MIIDIFVLVFFRGMLLVSVPITKLCACASNLKHVIDSTTNLFCETHALNTLARIWRKKISACNCACLWQPRNLHLPPGVGFDSLVHCLKHFSLHKIILKCVALPQALLGYSRGAYSHCQRSSKKSWRLLLGWMNFYCNIFFCLNDFTIFTHSFLVVPCFLFLFPSLLLLTLFILYFVQLVICWMWAKCYWVKMHLKQNIGSSRCSQIACACYCVFWYIYMDLEKLYILCVFIWEITRIRVSCNPTNWKKGYTWVEFPVLSAGAFLSIRIVIQIYFLDMWLS